jgi:hypothetical protein
MATLCLGTMAHTPAWDSDTASRQYRAHLEGLSSIDGRPVMRAGLQPPHDEHAKRTVWFGAMIHTRASHCMAEKFAEGSMFRRNKQSPSLPQSTCETRGMPSLQSILPLRQSMRLVVHADLRSKPGFLFITSLAISQEQLRSGREVTARALATRHASHVGLKLARESHSKRRPLARASHVGLAGYMQHHKRSLATTKAMVNISCSKETVKFGQAFIEGWMVQRATHDNPNPPRSSTFARPWTPRSGGPWSWRRSA